MMNDKLVYELLYQYISNLYDAKNTDQEFDDIINNWEDLWMCFCQESLQFEGLYAEIKHLINSIAKEIEVRDKIVCQYCRIDHGLYVQSPVKSENLCKKHRQEYEEQYIDKTLRQNHPGIGAILDE